MSSPAAEHRPRETEAYEARVAAEQQVAADLPKHLHSREVAASHPGRPTPAEAVDRGVTPASGGECP